MRSESYQIALITLGIFATVLLAFFLYREIFPEYRLYQNDYVALEKFRSSYMKEPPPVFQEAVKQIVFERDDKGPAKIDRCTSCHVAVQLPHFSPTKIGHDVNGNIIRSVDGSPVKVPNDDYVWARLDKKIEELTDPKVNEQLAAEGQSAKVESRKREAASLQALKTAKVGHQTYDVTKVLAMHPLIGKETRPFEFHPLEEYGCTTCHSGNGRGLTTEKAHGPVFDGEYEAEFLGEKPQFTEKDPHNDPKFSKIFNDKPGDALLFQTTPILVGNLIQSSCIQCHVQSSAALQGLADTASSLVSKRIKKTNAIKKGLQDEEEALFALIELKKLIQSKGLDQAINVLKNEAADPEKNPKQREYLTQRILFLEKNASKPIEERQKEILNAIQSKLISMVGSEKLIETLENELANSFTLKTLQKSLTKEEKNNHATGSVFDKLKAIQLEKALLTHIEDTQTSLFNTADDQEAVEAITSDIDWMTHNYKRGKELYLSQACYACHRIAGMTRGGVGPELTQSGHTYPWFLKESIVWPQADLRTSTMPNFVLDHVELEDLMTFLLAQKGATRAVSQTEYKLSIQEWEAGRKMAWEKPIPPSKIHDLRYGMTVFATQGCAACHRLEGFDSNVGFRIEKEGKPDFNALYKEHEWFKNLFPEEILGSSLIATLEENSEIIDQRLVDDVRHGSILEEIEEKHPELIEAFYSNFRFASRSKNHVYHELADKAPDSEKKEEALSKLKAWQDRVKRVLMMYVQEYGLGRLVGPRPNWAGIYRSDEWLMEHFHNPSSHVARSIMPVLPFDDSKFYALTYMLDILGKRNRDALRTVWEQKGFRPEMAYQIFCSQCHGNYLQGNGPISTWIYPVPKNLRNAEFLRNLTRENVIQSITHGVKGTPMPPWGEHPQPKPDYDGIPILNSEEIRTLADWLFSFIPGSNVIKNSADVPKWNYHPQDVIDELKREGNLIKFKGDSNQKNESENGFSPAKSQLGFSTKDLEGLNLKEKIPPALRPQNSHESPPKDDFSDVFSMEPNPVPGGDKEAYYIKKQYYTKENLEKGQDFFELNCAVCHGKEADGSGIRAGVMLDAKPRMLTNFDWIKTRDDLRLLRSIKYGVAGTAMTPWGDLTSSMQRLQLVMYIRTLTQEKEKKDTLLEALYAVYEPEQSAVEELRIVEFPLIDSLRKNYQALKKQRKISRIDEDGKERDVKLALYQKELELEEQLGKAEEKDKVMEEIKILIGKEKDLFFNIGNDMISSNADEAIWKKFLTVLSLNGNLFIFKEGKLSVQDNPENQEQMQKSVNEIITSLDVQQASAEKEKTIIQGRFPSNERDESLKAIQIRLATIGKLKGRLLSGIREIEELKAKELALYQKLMLLEDKKSEHDNE